MSVYSVWPFFGCLLVLLALAATPLFAAADAPPSDRPQRIATVDGLRGFLALAVFFHHAAIYHGVMLSGRWDFPPSRFYALLGPAGVSMFFMITGYLFWGRLLKERGQTDWLRLFTGRVFRIGPLYLAAIAAMLLIVFGATGPNLDVPPYDLVRQLASWLPLGIDAGQPDVNGYPQTWSLLAGVTWSLQCEWLFYFSLPALAIAARTRKHLAFAASGTILCLLGAHFLPIERPERIIYTALFSVGMTSASLRRMRIGQTLPDKAASALTVILVGTALVLPTHAYSVSSVVLLGTAFYLIVSGCTLFGVLASRPARRLGDISYGIYLLQGLALAAAFRPPVLRTVALSSPVAYWCLAFAAAVLLIGISTAAHAWIERPGISLGKYAAAVVRRGALERA